MTIDAPAYAIVGRGPWARRMSEVLAGESRRTAVIEGARQQPAEGESAYHARLRHRFAKSYAQVAWLCVPPGPHVPVMIRAALEAGLHVIAEKPWLGSPSETSALTGLAREVRRVVAVHYEYCLLDEVSAWRAQFAADASLTFGGRFHHSRISQSQISPLDNLGTHLLSIRAWAAPQSRIGTFDCAYRRADERRVWLEREGARIAEIDLLASRERIIQRFIANMESALSSADFPFDLNFALRVAADAEQIRRRGAEAAG